MDNFLFDAKKFLEVADFKVLFFMYFYICTECTAYITLLSYFSSLYAPINLWIFGSIVFGGLCVLAITISVNKYYKDKDKNTLIYMPLFSIVLAFSMTFYVKLEKIFIPKCLYG